MKWTETTADQCRYGDIAERIWGDWDIIWEDSEADWQGHASFVAEKDGKYCFYEWWYGSCSGCDGWESDGSSEDEIEAEMRDTALWIDSKDEMMRWLDVLTGSPHSNYEMKRGGGLAAGIDMLVGGLLGRVNAIRAHFGMPPYNPNAPVDETP